MSKRLAFVDALKAIASQLIVLHHLAFYGPLSDVANELAPAFFSWLSHDARIAVQIFLVISGFLAARTLAPAGALTAVAPLALLGRRYLKLVVPYVAALVLAIVCAAIARRLMLHDSIPNPPTTWQILAHITLLQNVLDFDSLSAGVWYIAIDFQLFTLLLGVLWLARTLGRTGTRVAIVGIVCVAALALVSLLSFNRDANWDNWGLYFFGAYALGVLASWATQGEKKPGWLLLMTAVVIVVLIIDFRSRIAVALVTALALGLAQRWQFIADHPKGRLLAAMGKISYAVFLVHFPVILVINGVFSQLAPESPTANALGIVIAWGASMAVGAAFYRFVESPASRWHASIKVALSEATVRRQPAFKTKCRGALSP